MIVRIVVDVLQLYLVALFVRIVLTWIPINPWSPMARVVRALAAVTDPILVPIRRLLPPVRLGATALDLSPIIVFVVIEILLRVIVSG